MTKNIKIIKEVEIEVNDWDKDKEVQITITDYDWNNHNVYLSVDEVKELHEHFEYLISQL